MTKEQFTMEYQNIYKDLYKMALYTLGNEEDAKDIVSDTVLDAFAGSSSLRDESKFRSWIFKILSNKCKKKIKEYVANREFLVELGEDIPGSNEPSIDKILLAQALSSISEKERLIVNMILVAGFSSREVGKILMMKDTTVRSTYSRSIKKMQSIIDSRRQL